jgi:PAS domain S-box-containing protein
MDKRKLLGAHLLDHAPAAIIATDIDGKILYWNRGAESLYGWSATEALGEDIVDLLVAERGQTGIAGRLDAGKPWEGEQWRLRRDGSRFLAHVAVTPVFDTSGKQVARIGVSIDVSSYRLRACRNGGPTREQAAAIGERIAKARREAGVTQKELAKQLGVSVRSVQGYESGAVTPHRRLNHIAELLQTSVEWLLASQPLVFAGVGSVVTLENLQI